MDYEALVLNTSRLSGRLSGVPWVPICVLSREAIKINETLEALKQMATDSSNGPLRRYYLVSLGLSHEDLCDSSTDLETVIDQLTVVNENQAKLIIEDVVKYASCWVPPWDSKRALLKSISTWVGNALRDIFALFIYHLGYIFHFVSLVTLSAFPIIVILLAIGIDGNWRSIVALCCYYSVGYGLISSLNSLDLWPFLGPNWVV